jgi:hypothetical protein
MPPAIGGPTGSENESISVSNSVWLPRFLLIM